MQLKKDFFSIILIMIMLIGVFYFGVESKPTEMGLIIIACAICLSFANIGRIQKFKGAGFEAEMKKAVDKAYATTENIKALAEPLIISTLDNLTFAGRWGGMDSERKHELKESIDKIVNSLEIDHSEAISAQNNFHFWHGLDHINYLTTIMGKKQINNREVAEEIMKLFDPSLSELPSEIQLRDSLSGLDDEEINKLEPYIKDYVYYKNNHKLRRKEALNGE